MQRRSARSLVVAIPVIALCAARALWPSDIQFVLDEPKLVLKALAANADRSLARSGLLGTVGVHYGPTPTWLYQLAAAVTHDLRWWVVARGIAMAAATVLGLWWAAQASGFRRRGFLVAVLASPYLWYFDRVLWDNTFAIPLVALAWGAYGRWLAERDRRMVAVWSTALCLLPSIHLMSVAFVLPMAVHAVVDTVRRRRVRDVLIGCIPAAIVTAVIAWAYLPTLLRDLPSGPRTAKARSALLVLTGPEWFTGHGLDVFYGNGWASRGPVPSLVVRAAAAVSLVTFALAGWGLLLVARRGTAAIADRDGARSPVGTYAGLALVVLVLQSGLDLWAGTGRLPHYLSSTWVIWVWVIWFGLERLPAPAARALVATVAVSLVVVTSSSVLTVHRDRGVREGIYGPSLGQLRAAAAQIGRGTVVIHADGVSNLARFPEALAALRALLPPGAPGPCEEVTVGYRSESPRDARITVRCDRPRPA